MLVMHLTVALYLSVMFSTCLSCNLLLDATCRLWKFGDEDYTFAVL